MLTIFQYKVFKCIIYVNKYLREIYSYLLYNIQRKCKVNCLKSDQFKIYKKQIKLFRNN